jgi:hypothetical protein
MKADGLTCLLFWCMHNLIVKLLNQTYHQILTNGGTLTCNVVFYTDLQILFV